MDPIVSCQVEGRLFDPVQGEFDNAQTEWAVAFVDLDACPHDATIAHLPPLPLIGIGDRSHPLAARLDAVLEPPMTAAQLIRQVEEAPRAAAVTIELLRTIEGMTVEAALVAESFAYGILQAGAEHAAWRERMRGSLHSTSAPGEIRIERRDTTLHVVLDRPHARNAIDRALRDGLYEAFELAAHDASLTSLKLRGVGKAFCVGADLTEFGTTSDPVVAHLIRRRTLPAVALARRASIVDVHIQGACVGAGLEIAAFAARVTATASAWFQLPELSMGVLAGAGGCVAVSRRIGRQRAALLLLSGKRIDAATALRWGLIDAIEEQPPIDESGAHVS